MVGKAEVGPWVGGYFEAVETRWEKTSVEFVISRDWAFVRYTYKAIDTPRAGGEAYTDTGNGINIYRLGADGTWRVARCARCLGHQPALAGQLTNRKRRSHSASRQQAGAECPI